MEYIDVELYSAALGPVISFLICLAVSCWSFAYRTWDLRLHMILVAIYAVTTFAIWSAFAYLPYQTLCNITQVTANTTIQVCHTEYIDNPYARFSYGILALLFIHAIWVVILWLYYGIRGLERGRIVIYERE